MLGFRAEDLSNQDGQERMIKWTPVFNVQVCAGMVCMSQPHFDAASG